MYAHFQPVFLSSMQPEPISAPSRVSIYVWLFFHSPTEARENNRLCRLYPTEYISATGIAPPPNYNLMVDFSLRVIVYMVWLCLLLVTGIGGSYWTTSVWNHYRKTRQRRCLYTPLSLMQGRFDCMHVYARKCVACCCMWVGYLP